MDCLLGPWRPLGADAEHVGFAGLEAADDDQQLAAAVRRNRRIGGKDHDARSSLLVEQGEWLDGEALGYDLVRVRSRSTIDATSMREVAPSLLKM